MKVRKRKKYLNRTLNPLGRRCPGFHPGCMICQSYRYFDEHGRFPSFDEADCLACIANRLISAVEGSSLPEINKKMLLDLVDHFGVVDLRRYEADEGPLASSVLAALQEDARRRLPTGEILSQEHLFHE